MANISLHVGQSTSSGARVGIGPMFGNGVKRAESYSNLIRRYNPMVRFGFLFSEVFWGVFLIFIGIALVLKVLFNFNIPIFRLAVAFCLIYAGISMLVGGFGVTRSSQNDIIFDDSELKVTEPKENYNVIFAKGTIDLSQVTAVDSKIEINTIFGAGTIRINPALPVKVTVNSAFAGARMPDGNTISFGNSTYYSPNYKEGEKFLAIDTNVVFGSLEFITD
ncbi:LiaF domain-containing protein [Hydrogenispora ethanolica]|nr:LiaF domain-containing protein [Hydrogenispora ethanolica]